MMQPLSALYVDYDVNRCNQCDHVFPCEYRSPTNTAAGAANNADSFLRYSTINIPLLYLCSGTIYTMIIYIIPSLIVILSVRLLKYNRLGIE